MHIYFFKKGLLLCRLVFVYSQQLLYFVKEREMLEGVSAQSVYLVSVQKKLSMQVVDVEISLCLTDIV